MKLTDLSPLEEGVVVHGNEFLAYVVTIAEIYAEKPRLEQSAIPNWEALITSNDVLAQRVLSDIDVQYVTDDPYGSPKDVINDVIVNRRLKVYKTPDSKHPFFSSEQNDVFRALHDALAHVGGNSSKYRQFLRNSPGGTPKNYKLAWGSGFTVRGEMNAYLTHSRVAPRKAVPALFTEIVGQICTFFVTKDFAPDKVAILDGVDFKNLGVLYGSRKDRMDEILSLLDDESVDIIQTNVKGVQLDKSKIRWGMLSRGERVTR